MFIKACGCLCIVGATAAVGFSSALALKKRLTLLSDLERGLQLLKSEISYSLRPLPEAMEAVAFRLTGLSSAFFHEAGRCLQQGEVSSAAAHWSAAAAKVLSASPLLGEDLAVLESFGQTLGLRDKAQQAAAAEFAAAALCRLRTEGLARYEKQAGLRRSLGILGGILFCVLLL